MRLYWFFKWIYHELRIAGVLLIFAVCFLGCGTRPKLPEGTIAFKQTVISGDSTLKLEARNPPNPYDFRLLLEDGFGRMVVVCADSVQERGNPIYIESVSRCELRNGATLDEAMSAAAKMVAQKEKQINDLNGYLTTLQDTFERLLSLENRCLSQRKARLGQ